MTTKPETPTLAEVQDALAAMEVACDTCANVTDKEGWARGCPDCHGTGTRPRFPALRAACRGGRWNSSNAWPCKKGKLQWNPGHKGKIIEVNHETCQGRGWVPSRDWAAVRQEAREAGWTMDTTSSPRRNGDGVLITIGKPESEPATYIDVWANEGLRDQHAETVALWRAAVAQSGG